MGAEGDPGRGATAGSANLQTCALREGTTRIQVEDHREMVKIVVEGPLTDAALIDVFGRLHAMPEFERQYRVLFDATRTSASRLTADGVFRLAQATRADTNRTAIAVATPVNFAMARMYELCSSRNDGRVKVFMGLEPALEWLENPQPPAQG